jgi:hypothetical protein
MGGTGLAYRVADRRRWLEPERRKEPRCVDAQIAGQAGELPPAAGELAERGKDRRRTGK